MALKPLTLEQLISAPLRALVLGQHAATQTTADFLSQLGFETAAGKVPSARTLEFEYLHPVPDPANPGSTIDTPTRLRVPLLTMLPIPNFRIAEANVGFGANVVGMKTVRPAKRTLVVGSDLTAEASTQLFARYAPSVAAPGESPPTLTVSIKVVGQLPTEGLTRVLSALADSITSAPAVKPR
ncbi:MAG: DUF2589 domain-containing protein [Verrucomicrobia bacterium]|nr:DUF2589 domain-containing protein [Verrucomicrobiota bacterium]MBI4659243.1 DUF2589 domain-containing protein [Verrucomicrobiota bacterium]